MPCLYENENRAFARTEIYINGKNTGHSFCPEGDEASFALCLNAKAGNIPEFYNCRFYLGNDDGVIIHGEETEKEIRECGVLLRSKPYKLKKGLYFFHFELETPSGLLFTREEEFGCSLANEFSGEYRFTVYDESKNTALAPKGIMYHVFIDRFYKYNHTPHRSDALYIDDINTEVEFSEKAGGFLKNNTFYGGTLDGVTEKLDYIKSLGADMIYLSPVCKAYSNHKYDTGDFMTVDEDFGGEKALKRLTDEAEKKGIRIILDGVFNHVGDDSLYFNKYNKYDSVGAYNSKQSPYFDWFSFENYPDGYDCWWGIKNLPKINKTESYKQFITQKVIPKYCDLNAAGWRLDVVDEYSGEFLERIVAKTKEKNPQAPVIGEVWEDAGIKVAYGERKNYFCGGRLDGVTNYPFRNALIDFITGRDVTALSSVLESQYKNYPSYNRKFLMNMTGSHDTPRIINALADKTGDGLTPREKSRLRLTDDERERAKNDLKNFCLFTVAQTGIPCLYYGDETGAEGCADPFCRRPLNWEKIDKELYDFFALCGKLRLEYHLGEYEEEKFFDPAPGVFVGEYMQKDAKIVVIFNRNEEEYSFSHRGIYKDLVLGVLYRECTTVKGRTCTVALRVTE